MEDTGQILKELLGVFLKQNTIDKMESRNGLIKIYRVGNSMVRIDIKLVKGVNKP